MSWATARLRLAEKTRDFFGRAVVYHAQGHAPVSRVAIVRKPGERTSIDGSISNEIDGIAWVLDAVKSDLPAYPRAGDTVEIPGLGSGSFEVVSVDDKDGASVDVSLIEV